MLIGKLADVALMPLEPFFGTLFQLGRVGTAPLAIVIRINLNDAWALSRVLQVGSWRTTGACAVVRHLIIQMFNSACLIIGSWFVEYFRVCSCVRASN